MKQDIQSILKSELRTRQKSNSSYSLRAFARDIQLSPGYLSDLMKGKKKVSVDTAMKISKALSWSWRDTQVFLQMSQLSAAKSKSAARFIKNEIHHTQALYNTFTRIKPLNFTPISDWYFFAIMELTDLPGFKNDAGWISQRLGISIATATEAISLLKEHGYIAQDSDGRWVKRYNLGVKDTPSSALRKFHRQHLRNAELAIEEQAYERRHASGITMAIDAKQLPAAINLITEFRARMSALLETGTKDSVYHLAVQLFQLDKPHTSKGDSRK
ncbi:MAG: TIGR02147 family protein [Pseudobdellovibrionaceae bacterium]